MDVSDQNELFLLFKAADLSKEPLPAADVLEIILDTLKIIYEDGTCAKCMIKGEPYEAVVTQKTYNTTVTTVTAATATTATTNSEYEAALTAISTNNPIEIEMASIKNIEEKVKEVTFSEVASVASVATVAQDKIKSKLKKWICCT